MKKILLFALLCIVIFSLFGCSGGLVGGGSGGGANSARDNGGSMTLTVNWPGAEASAASKSVLSSAYSLKVNVCTETQTRTSIIYVREVNAALIVRRSSSATSDSAVMNGIPAGARTVIVQAFDSSATQIGYGTRSVTIKQGDNDGINVYLAEGTFPYSIEGPGDVPTPASGGGGGGESTVTAHYYIFVNNFGGNSISVIDEAKTTNRSTGESAYSYSVPSGGTITGIPKPCKGVFNDRGSVYYATSADPARPAIIRIAPNANDWSSSEINVLASLGTGYLPQEILYDSGYLYVGVKYYDDQSGQYSAFIKKYAAGTGRFLYASDPVIGGSFDITITGLYKVAPNKILATYASNNGNTLWLAKFTDNGPNNFSQTSPAVSANYVSTKIANAFNVSGLTVTDNGLVLVPCIGLGYGSVLSFTINGDYSNFAFTFAGDSPERMFDFRKILYYNGVIYALNPNYLYYGTLSRNIISRMYKMGSPSGAEFADMAFSTDKNRMYITDFGTSVYPYGGFGNTVYIKTLSPAASVAVPVAVGNNPFGVALKPAATTE